MNIIQVVKRFGLCGGMEEYVFQLSKELCNLGLSVKILCETQVGLSDERIEVVQLGQTLKKPRWYSHLSFARKVQGWVSNNQNEQQIIHSHERISCHNLTTIHSTLFNYPPKGFPTIRKFINESLERRELSSSGIRAIVPVSDVISDQIKCKYPEISNMISTPISPGTDYIDATPKDFAPESPILGFMGKEWKRKGLTKIMRIWRELRKTIPQVKLCLAGFDSSEKIGLKPGEEKFVTILGVVRNKANFYEQIDLLLHPAQREAFGMVIAEALSLGIPVVCSSECGAASVNPHKDYVLNYNRPLGHWVKATRQALFEPRKKTDVKSWSMVASDYARLYASFHKSGPA